MSQRSTSFLGAAGQLHVMAEFLERGWNVGQPAVDTGDDLLVNRHATGEMSRIQVKAARATPRRYGYSAEFYVGTTQLHTVREPPIEYIFVVRLAAGWGPHLVIEQSTLKDLVVNDDMGTAGESTVNFYVRYKLKGSVIESVLCSDSELTAYVDDFSRWERIEH